MTYSSLADILAANEAAQARFADTIASLNEAQLNFRPAPDNPQNESWTIAEIAEHLAIVNDGFLRITHKLLKQAETARRAPRAELDLKSVLLDSEGRQPAVKFPAPDRVKPKGGISVADALAKMRATLDGFADIRARIEATDLTEEKFPHPAVGEISAYHWMIVLHEHLDRHREQVERIKASSEFPK